MTAVVERNGAFALKVFGESVAPMANLVLALTAKLRTAGVPVPETWKDVSTGGLRQPWIDGPTLKEILIAKGPMQAASDFACHCKSVHGVMAALAKLHGAGDCSIGFPVFDPFRLIDRRLDTFPLGNLSPDNRKLARENRSRLGVKLSSFESTGLIHGDLHAGQLIREEGAGLWWLIDLDDVALGPPEADIGNFCAHIASAPAINGAGICETFAVSTAICASGYEKNLDANLIAAFGAAALTRRALKCAERNGRAQHVSDVLLAARRLVH